MRCHIFCWILHFQWRQLNQHKVSIGLIFGSGQLPEVCPVLLRSCQIQLIYLEIAIWRDLLDCKSGTRATQKASNEPEGFTSHPRLFCHFIVQILTSLIRICIDIIEVEVCSMHWCRYKLLTDASRFTFDFRQTLGITGLWLMSYLCLTAHAKQCTMHPVPHPPTCSPAKSTYCLAYFSLLFGKGAHPKKH